MKSSKRQSFSLAVPREKAKAQIRNQISKGKTLKEMHIVSQEDLEKAKAVYSKWANYNVELLTRLFDSDTVAWEYIHYMDTASGVPVYPALPLLVDNFRRNIQRAIIKLESVVERLEIIPELAETTKVDENLSMKHLQRILNRFHSICRQLRNRHANRPTIDVGDEYDVQDLLHALLKLEFDDIRPEEWTPSYAGSASKMDFLLKKEHIVIEAKKTRKGLGPKEVGEELIIDIAKYKEHPDCKILVCFIYDPDGIIGNPKGLKRDLEKMSKDPKVVVYIYPE